MFPSPVKQPTLPITADLQAQPPELLVKIFGCLLLRSQKSELNQSYSSISKTCRLWSQLSQEPSLKRLFSIRLAILFSPPTQYCLSSIQDGRFAPYTQVLIDDAKTRYGELYSQLKKECRAYSLEKSAKAELKCIDLVCDWAKMPSTDLREMTTLSLSKAPIEYHIKYADLLHRVGKQEEAKWVFRNIFEHLSKNATLLAVSHNEACQILVRHQPAEFLRYFTESTKIAVKKHAFELIECNPLFIPEALEREFFGLIPWDKVEPKRLATWVDDLAFKIFDFEEDDFYYEVKTKAETCKANYRSVLLLLKEKYPTVFKNLLPHLYKPYENYPDALAWEGFQKGAQVSDSISNEAFEYLLCIKKKSLYQKKLEALIQMNRLSNVQLNQLFKNITDDSHYRYFSDLSLKLLGLIVQKRKLNREQRSTLKRVLWWAKYFAGADAPGAVNIFQYLGFKETRDMLLKSSNSLEQRTLCCQWLTQQCGLFSENRREIFEIGCTLVKQCDAPSVAVIRDIQVAFLCVLSMIAIKELSDREKAIDLLEQAFQKMQGIEFRVPSDVFVAFFKAKFHPILYSSSEDRQSVDSQLESLMQREAFTENASAGARAFIRNFLAHRAVVDVAWAKQSLEGVLNRIGDFGGDFYQLVSWMLSRSEPHLKSIAQTFVKNHIESRGDKAELYNEILNSIPWHKIEPEQVTYWLIILSPLNEFSQFELIEEVQYAAEYECHAPYFIIRNTFYRALWGFPTSVVDKIRFFNRNERAFAKRASESSQSDFKEMAQGLLSRDISDTDRVKSYRKLAAHLNIFELSDQDREDFLSQAIVAVRSTTKAELEALHEFYRKILVHVDAPVIKMIEHFLEDTCKRGDLDIFLLNAICSYCKDSSLVMRAHRIIFDSSDDPLRISFERCVPPEEILSAILNDSVRPDQLKKALSIVDTLVDNDLKSSTTRGSLREMLRLKKWYEKIALLSEKVFENGANMIAAVESGIVRVDKVIEKDGCKRLGSLFSLSSEYPKLRKLWRKALSSASLEQAREGSKGLNDLSLAHDIQAVFGEGEMIRYLFQVFFPNEVKNKVNYDFILG